MCSSSRDSSCLTVWPSQSSTTVVFPSSYAMSIPYLLVSWTCLLLYIEEWIQSIEHRPHPWSRGYISLNGMSRENDKAVAPPTDFRKQPSPSHHSLRRSPPNAKARQDEPWGAGLHQQKDVLRWPCISPVAMASQLCLLFSHHTATISTTRDEKVYAWTLIVIFLFLSSVLTSIDRCVYVTGWVYRMVHYLDHVVCTLCWKADAMGCWSRSYHRRYTQRQLAKATRHRSNRMNESIQYTLYHHHHYQYCINDDDSLATASYENAIFILFWTFYFLRQWHLMQKLNEGCARSGWAHHYHQQQKEIDTMTPSEYSCIWEKKRGKGKKSGGGEELHVAKRFGQHCVTFTYCCWAQDMWKCTLEWGMRISNIGKEVSKWSALKDHCVCVGEGNEDRCRFLPKYG